MTMKLIQLLAVSAVLTAPIASFAQSNEPVTRESVRAELVELQKAGYNPASDQTQYPRNIEAVEARLHSQDRLVQSSYGLPAASTSEAGAPARTNVADFGPDYSRP
jgi:uncharacterized protein YgbK (DUF1537 family)